jgi:hypothetical protein
MAQQPLTGAGPPHYEVSRLCGRTPWANDQLAARWPSHHPPQISNQSPLAIRPAETPSSETEDWERNMATQFCLQSLSTLVGALHVVNL